MIALCLQKEHTSRPDATELLKNPFFKKAKNREFLIENLINKAPSLEDRRKKNRQKPQSSDGGHDEDDDWEFEDTEENEATQPASASTTVAAPTSAAPTPANPAAPATTTTTTTTTTTSPQPEEQSKPSQPQQPAAPATTTLTPPAAAPTTDAAVEALVDKVFDLTLRLRSSSKELNDIRFEFDRKKDSVEGVAQELMSAGLIDGQDLLIVGANMHKIIANPVETKQLTFSLKSAQDEGTERDEKALFGYAMLTLNN